MMPAMLYVSATAAWLFCAPLQCFTHKLCGSTGVQRFVAAHAVPLAVSLVHLCIIDVHLWRMAQLQVADDIIMQRRELPEVYNATWGLDSIDQPLLPLDSIYHYDYTGKP